MIYVAVCAAMGVSIALMGIAGPIVVSLLLELCARRYGREREVLEIDHVCVHTIRGFPHACVFHSIRFKVNIPLRLLGSPRRYYPELEPEI